LWEKTSAKGNRYFVGRMGGVRVLVMENSRAESERDGTHTLFFAEAPAYDGNRSLVAPTGSLSSALDERPPRRGCNRPKLDDEVPPLVDDAIPF
jgi:hypothetical protein